MVEGRFLRVTRVGTVVGTWCVYALTLSPGVLAAQQVRDSESAREMRAASRFRVPPCSFALPMVRCREPYLSRSVELANLAAEDHRYEGAIAGFVVVGIGGYILVSELCNASDSSGDCGSSAFKAGITLGALGALTGAIVGAQIPKDSFISAAMGSAARVPHREY